MLPGAHQTHVVSGVSCAVLTVSDTRTPETDSTGALIRELLIDAGHVCHDYAIRRDEPVDVEREVVRWCDDPACACVIINGGTGISARDRTWEAIVALIERRIDGFGELFRALSFQDIGPAAMLSRAVAGVRNSTAVFSLPGSPPAARLGMERLILPTLGHLVWLLKH